MEDYIWPIYYWSELVVHTHVHVCQLANLCQYKCSQQSNFTNKLNLASQNSFRMIGMPVLGSFYCEERQEVRGRERAITRYKGPVSGPTMVT